MRRGSEAGGEVTARVKADASFRRLFQGSPAPFLVLAPDPPHFTITEVNDAYLAATMRRREDLVGRGVFEAFPDNPDDATIAGVSTLRASLDRVLASRQPSTLPGLQYDIARPDGTFEQRWWSPVNSPVLDEHGEVEAIIHNANDVTEERRAEAALRENAAKLQAVLDAVPAAIWIARDPEALRIDGNELARTVLRAPTGVNLSVTPAEPAEALTGFRVLDREGVEIAPENLPVQRAARGETVRDFEEDIVFDDGVVVSLIGNADPLFDAHGRPRGSVASFIDITGRKRDEHRRLALVELGDRIRDTENPDDLAYAAADILGRTLGVSRVGYGRVDHDDETLHVERDWTAPGVSSLAGVLNLRGFGSFIDAMKRGELDAIGDVGRDARASGVEAAALGARSALSFVNAPVLEQGRLVAVFFVNHAEARDWTEGDLALIKDFADRTRTAVERARSEARLRELNETLEQQVAERTAELERNWRLSQDMLVINEPDGSLAAVNDAWLRALGWTGEELVGTTFMDLAHPDDLEPTLEQFKAVFETPLTEPYEYRLRHKDGSYRWIAWTAIFHGGRVFANGRDVTERRERQAELEAAQEALRQSQKMEAMGQLTGGVAHDFNNLLTPIIGSLDMLQRRGVGGEREQRLIGGALQSADRAKTLVQRLLAFARRQPLQAAAVDVARLVTGMADLLGSTTGPQIRIVVDAPDDLPPANADPNQLEMALLNLGVNARDAMPDGGALRISASARRVDQGHRSGLTPGEYICLSVADTGVGMDAATLARAVEPFFSTKGVGKGTGLGLSMVHGLASQLGGALTIDSQPNVGTNIELWLPRSTAAAERVETARVATQHASPRGTALLVDDEELVRMSTADMLGELGYAVVEAASAEEALRIVDGGLQPDLLITDHLMPGMNGVELAGLLRARRSSLAVLVVSGYAEADGLPHDLPRLTKPFRNSDLAASLAELIVANAP